MLEVCVGDAVPAPVMSSSGPLPHPPQPLSCSAEAAPYVSSLHLLTVASVFSNAHAISWLISIRRYLLTSFYAPPLFSLSTGFGYVMMLFMSLEYLHRNQYWTTVHFRNKWLCCLSTVVLLLLLCILTGMIVIRLILSSSKMSRVLSVTPSSLLRLLLLWGPASGHLTCMCSTLHQRSRACQCSYSPGACALCPSEAIVALLCILSFSFPCFSPLFC